MGVTYGISISSTEDRYIAIAEKALDGMAKAASPGAFLVDLLPIRGSFIPLCQWLILLTFCAFRFQSNTSRAPFIIERKRTLKYLSSLANGFLVRPSNERHDNGAKQ